MYQRNDFYGTRIAPRPDLILLDLAMPQMDGREALKDIKSNSNFCGIPTLVLTTSELEEDIDEIYHLGANSTICKPVSFKSLKVTMMCHHWSAHSFLVLSNFREYYILYSTRLPLVF